MVRGFMALAPLVLIIDPGPYYRVKPNSRKTWFFVIDPGPYYTDASPIAE
jgi:hypothetical protein